MSRAQLTSTVEQNTGGAVSPYVAGKNAIINGGFDICQRGTSFSLSSGATAVYTADRFGVTTVSGAATVSRQLADSTLPQFKYCIRVQRNSGETATGGQYLAQSVESLNTLQFVNKTISLSFYARKGADYSTTSSLMTATIWSGNASTDGNILTASGFGSGQATVAQVNVSLTTSWQRFTITGTIGSTVTQVAATFNNGPSGTAGTNDYFEITGVQLELGSVATPFSRAGGTLSGELAACQRYYYRLGGAATYETFAQVVWISATAGNAFLKVASTLRTNNPSVEFSALRAVISSTAGVSVNSVSNVTLTQNGNGNFFNLTVTSGGSLPIGFTGWIDSNNNTAGYLALNSEL